MINAELFEYNIHITKYDAIKCLDEYGKKIQWKPHGDRVVDIGCAGGGVTNIFKTQYIPTEYSQLVGCDISENMVKFAREHYGDSRTEFHVLDIQGKLPKAFQQSFDHVVSFTTLHWIRNQEAAFRNIYDMLANNGDCLLLFMPSTQFYDVYRILSKDPKWSEWLTDVERFISPYQDSLEPEKEIYSLMEKIGFKNIEVTCRPNKSIYNDVAKLKDTITCVNPFNIPKEQMEAYLEDFTRTLRDINGINDAENHITIYYKSLIAYARK